MAVAELIVEKRDAGSQTLTKALRRSGRIPGVYYASDADPIPLSTDMLTFKRLISNEVNVIDIVFPDKKSYKCVFREIQRDPVTDEIIHIDLLGIKLDVEVSLMIPVILKGVPIGVKDEGGIMEHGVRQIEVKGLPLEIPEHIEIDVSELGIGEAIHVRDIKLDKVEILTSEDQDLASVHMPKVVAEPEVEEELEAGVEGEEGAAEDSEEETPDAE